MTIKLPLTKILAFTALAAMLTTAVFIRNAKSHNYELSDLETLAGEIYNGNLTGLQDLPLANAAIEKLTYELKGIISKPRTRQNCQVYFLKTLYTADFPILQSSTGIVDGINMKAGQVWKVGKTCLGEKARYNNTFYKDRSGLVLTFEHLEFQEVFSGTETECLILEKLLIYTYPVWSGTNLPKPPGNKIYR